MLRRCVLVAGLCVVAMPAAAGATFTSSQISTPAEGARLLRTTPSDAIAVSGTTVGGTPSENVNLGCDQPPGLPAATLPTAPQATLAGDGSFSTTGASTGNVTGACLLRALPDAVAGGPGYAGRWVIFERRVDQANAGAQYGFEDFVQQGAGATGILPLGVLPGAGGGLSGTRLTDTAGRRNSFDLFFYAGGVLSGDLSVDGRTAYTPTHAFDVAPGAPGSPTLGVIRTRATPDGDATVSESAPLARCNGDAASCAAGFAQTGVRWDRVTTTSADGAAFEQRDTLTSTDGAAHAVSAWIGYSTLTAGGETPAFGVSWAEGGTRAVRAPGTQFGGPPGGAPGTLLVDRNAAAADGDFLWPRAAITWDRGPVAVRFGASKEAAARFEDIAVPAGGAITLRTRYLVGTRAGELATAAERQRDSARAPALTLGGLAAGATVLTSSATLRGTASDTEGLASLVVGGRAVTPGADGSYTALVPLKLGANTITATATDAAGQTTSASLTVTYKDVIAPFLSALSVARRSVRAGRPLTVRFRLGEASTVTLRAGGRTARVNAKRGANSVAFSTRKLKPGRYRLAVTARDGAGNASRTFRARFRVTGA